MKPKRIILVRHGESVGNVDHNIYETVPDWKIDLTQIGRMQAVSAGQQIKSLVGDETVKVYSSPYYRTRQTLQGIREGGLDKNIVNAFEDPRLREQDWGHTGDVSGRSAMIDERNEFSTFYYRIKDGESGADVFDRVSTFFETMHRDFFRNSFPENVVIVTHGMTLRLFLMRWFHWTPEEFENVRNPYNGQVFVMNNKSSRRDMGSRFELETKLRYRDGATD